MSLNIKKYFKDIFWGLSSTLKGMRVTFRHLGRKPVTVCHPEVDVEKMLPERYRGLLSVNTKICVSCKLCMRTCPIGCIVIEDVKGKKEPIPAKDGTRKMFKMKNVTRFDIDAGKCMFCGFCVEACPTGAIVHTRKFSRCVYTAEELIHKFVSDEEKEKFIELEKEIKAEEEKAKALAEKAKLEAKK